MNKMQEFLPNDKELVARFEQARNDLLQLNKQKKDISSCVIQQNNIAIKGLKKYATILGIMKECIIPLAARLEVARLEALVVGVPPEKVPPCTMTPISRDAS